MITDPADGPTMPTIAIRRVGRWTYSISISHGLIRYGDETRAIGRRRADRKGARLLAKYLRCRCAGCGWALGFVDNPPWLCDDCLADLELSSRKDTSWPLTR